MSLDDYGNEVYHCIDCGRSFIQDFNEALRMCDDCVALDNSVEVLEEMAIAAGLSPQEPA